MFGDVFVKETLGAVRRFVCKIGIRMVKTDMAARPAIAELLLRSCESTADTLVEATL